MVFRFREKEYKLQNPTVGDLLQMELIKQELTNGRYYELSIQINAGTQSVLDYVDVESTLMVLCPIFIKEASYKSFSDLSPKDFHELLDAFVEQVVPWLRGYKDMMQAPYKRTDESSQEN